MSMDGGRVGNTLTPSRRIGLKSVNGWRGLGSLGVAFGHFAYATHVISASYLEPLTFLVDMFFVLSGVFIAQAYSERLRHLKALPEYVIRRLARIWPLQAATLALLIGYECIKVLQQYAFHTHFTLPPFAQNGSNSPVSILTNLALIHATGIHDRLTWNPPSWSLSVEFLTYLLFALVCLLAPWQRRILTILIIGFSLAILLFLAPYKMRSTFDYGIFRGFVGFFAGTLLSDFVTHRRLPHWPCPTIVELLAIGMMGLWLYASKDSNFALATPFLICLLMTIFFNESGNISKILSMNTVQFLSEISFAIYMMHSIVLLFIFNLLQKYQRFSGDSLFFNIPNPLSVYRGESSSIQVLQMNNSSIFIIFIIYISVVVLSSYYAALYVERPGRAYFNKFAKRFAARPHARQDDGPMVDATPPSPSKACSTSFLNSLGFQRAVGPLAGCQGGALTTLHKDEPRIVVDFSCGAPPPPPQKADSLLKPSVKQALR